jgi:hypothetical protein
VRDEVRVERDVKRVCGIESATVRFSIPVGLKEVGGMDGERQERRERDECVVYMIYMVIYGVVSHEIVLCYVLCVMCYVLCVHMWLCCYVVFIYFEYVKFCWHVCVSENTSDLSIV